MNEYKLVCCPDGQHDWIDTSEVGAHLYLWGPRVGRSCDVVCTRCMMGALVDYNTGEIISDSVGPVWPSESWDVWGYAAVVSPGTPKEE